MSQSFAFYDERAREAAAEAEDALLDNVRDRHLRAEKSWRTLANHALKVEEDRKKAAQVRLDRLAREERERNAAEREAEEARSAAAEG